MADEQRSAIGLSIGATNLAAVTADRSVTRKPMLTLYGQRAPEVGVPAENPALTEPGVVLTGFVGRVGDPAGVTAPDGTVHRSEALLADALRALAYTATDGRALPAAAVTYPAHWGPPAVAALRAALNRVPEWSGERMSLLADSAAALTALRSNPGLPARGIVAVCDFGGSGTNLTLVDAADGYRPVAATVRHTDFSGDSIDQALLNRVVADVAGFGPDPAGTATIGSMTALRGACRHAKEELSTTTSTTLTAGLGGRHDDVRITRAELEDLVRPQLDGVLRVIQQTLQRNGIQPGDLAAVAAFGGGAGMPVVTTRLSGQLRVPVIAAPRPAMTAAIGAALTAARRSVDDGATALAAAAGPVSSTDATAMTDVVSTAGPAQALAWSEADDSSGVLPIRTGEYPTSRRDDTAGTPRPVPEQTAPPRATRSAALPWYRRPAVVIIGTALVVLAIGAAVVIALRHTTGNAPTTPAPATPAPATESTEPSSTETPNSTPSSTTTEAPTTTQAPTTTTTEAPTTTITTSAPSSASTTTQAPQSPGYPLFPRRPGYPQGPPAPSGR